MIVRYLPLRSFEANLQADRLARGCFLPTVERQRIRYYKTANSRQLPNHPENFFFPLSPSGSNNDARLGRCICSELSVYVTHPFATILVAQDTTYGCLHEALSRFVYSPSPPPAPRPLSIQILTTASTSTSVSFFFATSPTVSSLSPCFRLHFPMLSTSF